MGQAQVGEGVSLELYDRLRELPTPLSRIWSLDPLPQGQWDAEPRMCPWKGSGVGRKVWGTPFAAKDPEAYGKWGLGLKWNFSNGHLRFSPPPNSTFETATLWLAEMLHFCPFLCTPGVQRAETGAQEMTSNITGML